MKNIRKIKVFWRNQRNISRIYRWLELGRDMQGNLLRKGEFVGYKTSSAKHLIFNFFI